ncbi:MAG: tRNA glutamyl-Q(34) synthetase GluQRS [Candidatus Eutrophobiaceae bacterium]
MNTITLTPVVPRGRFAPAPSGPLHFGSLVAALASFLQARSKQGLWFIRIDDLDTSRNVPNAERQILIALEALQLHWDGEIIRQSARLPLYNALLQELNEKGLLYPCTCPRRLTRGHAYSGACRNKPAPHAHPHALRLRVDARNSHIAFEDGLLGKQKESLALSCGDFIVRRTDGQIAYHLASIADDAALAITEVVRGKDLLDSAARQIYLQSLLGFPETAWVHIPLVLDEQGKKLSKQNHAPAAQPSHAPELLFKALAFLRQSPPTELRRASAEEIIAWGIAHWTLAALQKKP